MPTYVNCEYNLFCNLQYYCIFKQQCEDNYEKHFRLFPYAYALCWLGYPSATIGDDVRLSVGRVPSVAAARFEASLTSRSCVPVCRVNLQPLIELGKQIP